MTKGILRNKLEVEVHQDVTSDALDRQEVIRNTRLNAHLTSEHTKGDILRAKLAEQKAHEAEENKEIKPSENANEHLKWDELNLYKTEQEKCATMKIDEPKTPYEGGFNPEGEYYKEDEDIPGFELGEGEFNGDSNKIESLNGGEIIRNEEEGEEEEDQEPEEPEETQEERHKRFEEMRKKHYHLKGNALKHGIQISDDEEE